MVRDSQAALRTEENAMFVLFNEIRNGVCNASRHAAASVVGQ